MILKAPVVLASCFVLGTVLSASAHADEGHPPRKPREHVDPEFRLPDADDKHFHPKQGDVDRFPAALEQRIAYNNAVQHARSLGGFWSDRGLYELVNQLGRQVAEKVGRSGVEYRFAVIASRTPNAFSYGGGYVGVTVGLLQVLRVGQPGGKRRLKFVLGHELGHDRHRHMVWNLLQDQGLMQQVNRALSSGNIDRFSAIQLIQADQIEHRSEMQIQADANGVVGLFKLGIPLKVADDVMDALQGCNGAQCYTNPTMRKRREEIKKVGRSLTLEMNCSHCDQRYDVGVRAKDLHDTKGKAEADCPDCGHTMRKTVSPKDVVTSIKKRG